MTLLDVVRLTRAHAAMIVVLVLTGLGTAYLLTERMPHVYEADASGYVRVTGGAESTGEGIAATTLSGSKAESYLPIVDSRADGSGPASLAWAVRSVCALWTSFIASTMPHSRGP